MKSGAASISTSQPGPHNQPRYPGNGERDDSDQQVFAEPRQDNCIMARNLVEFAGGKDPSRVQTDRQPERSGLQSRVGQDPSDQKQGGKSGGDQNRIRELEKRVRD